MLRVVKMKCEAQFLINFKILILGETMSFLLKYFDKIFLYFQKRSDPWFSRLVSETR